MIYVTLSVCGAKIKNNVSKDGAASLKITLQFVCSVAGWEALSLQLAHSRRCSYVKKEKKKKVNPSASCQSAAHTAAPPQSGGGIVSPETAPDSPHWPLLHSPRR